MSTGNAPAVDPRHDSALVFRGLTFALLLVLPFWVLVALVGMVLV